VRKPEDRLAGTLRDVAVTAISEVEPCATYDTLDRYWIEAVGWTDSDTLRVRLRARYYDKKVLGTHDYVAPLHVSAAGVSLGAGEVFPDSAD